MVFVLAVVSACVAAAWACVRALRHRADPRADPPCLGGWLPLVGHAHMLMGDGVKMYRSLVRMSEECAEKGGLVTFHLGFHKVYGITDPEDCFTVMNTCLEKTLFMKFGKQFLGDGLITADVGRWQTSRKLLNPAFNQKVLNGFIDIFNEKAEDLVNKFASKMGKPFDQQEILRINNLEIICATSFDVNDSECDDILKRYLPLLLAVVNKISKRMQNFWLHNDFIYKMTGEKKQVDELIKKLVVLSQTMIQRKKSKLKRNVSNERIQTQNPKKFIDLILELGEASGRFTERQIREEADTIVFGAHDTTAITLSFALALLGSDERVQRKLYREIVQVCGNTDKSIEKQDLSKLVYTEAVLKETLRLYPIGLILPRHIDRDLTLKNYTIKAGSDCLIMVHGVHRHRSWAPDPDGFEPDRWLHRDSLPDHGHFAAFGLGKRSCIGISYALMSMKISLAHVIRRYSVSSDISQMMVSFQILSRPESGYFIALKRR